MTRRSALTLPFVALLAVAIPAQTFIVDANNGPGTHYKDIQAAVTAVPSGAVLRVRPASYGSFLIQGKSLSVIGDSRAVVVDGSVGVAQLKSHQRVLLADFTVASTQLGSDYLALTRNDGVIVVRNVDVRIGGGASYSAQLCDITDCANVQVLGSTLAGPVRLQRSFVQASHSTFVGMNGSSPLRVSLPGREAIRQIGGQVVLTLCTCVGGRGVNAYCPGPWPIRSSPGGDGVVTEPGSELTVLGGRIEGGPGGNAYPPSCPASSAGCALRSKGATITALGLTFKVCGDAATKVIMNGLAVPPVADLSGNAVPHGIVQMSLRGRPNSISLLFLGFDLGWTPLAPFIIGNLYCPPVVILGQFVTPANGALVLPLTIPAGWPRDVPLYGQYLSIEPAGLLWASNPILLLVKS